MNIFAYKDDGSFHRYWSNTTLLDQNDKYIITHTKKGTKVVEYNGYVWNTKEDAINYFSREKYFNAILILKEDGNYKYYINLALPSLIEANSIKYIDYDLDIKFNLNSNNVKVLDAKEFRDNIINFSYHPLLVQKIEQEVDNIREMIQQKQDPFNLEFINKYIGEINE